ncbi:hypothetical protein [Methylobacterium sp. GC_Met_2]|uniref:hypothetical protein n=1 Tax=Methylobacterium sp. GC_Met_2 TaxID=2937376 RepID=UPI00226B267B|nr:hypothetical protein [Methylobacterium sp. GC_Met_2]
MRVLLLASAILFPKMLLADQLEGQAQKVIESWVTHGENLRRDDRNGDTASCRISADTHLHVSHSSDNRCALAVMKYSSDPAGNEALTDAAALMFSPTDGWNSSNTTTDANDRKLIKAVFSRTTALFALENFTSLTIDAAWRGRNCSFFRCAEEVGYAERG